MNLLGIVLAPALLLSAGAMDRSGLLASVPGVETWSPIPGPARYGHSTIHDPVRNRLIVFGNELYENDVWALSLGDTPKWTRLATTGVGPPGRSYHSAIYDPHQDRMVVFGGVVKHFLGPNEYIPSPSNDVWALSLSSLTWTQLSVAGVPPPPRAYHTAVYDSIRDRMLVYGGGGGEPGYADLGDVWALDLSSSPSWLQVSSDTSPPPRRFHTAIYDALRDRMVVFGGSNSTGNLNDLWGLSLATAKWTELVSSGSGPPPGFSRAATYDAASDRVIVDGGSDNGVWMLPLNSLAWSVTTSFDGPDPRDGQTATFDPVRRRMVVFGGESGFGRDEVIALGDSWTFNVDERSWSPLVSANRQPPLRSGQTAVYDPIRKRMLVFGGVHRVEGDDFYMQDVWQLSLDGPIVWSPLPAAGDYPAGRAYHSAIYDPEGDRMIVFGGVEPVSCPNHPDEQCTQPLNDAWALNLGGAMPTWQKLAPLGDLPPSGGAPAAVYDPVRRRMLVFGGWAGTGHAIDVWALDLSGELRWSELSPGGTAPSARGGHTAIYDPIGDRMVVFGGGYPAMNDTWALDLAGAGTWRLLIPGSSTNLNLPPPRVNHAAAYDAVRHRMLVDGGYGPFSGGQGTPGNDTWALSLGPSPTWSPIVVADSPAPGRATHSAILDPAGQRMVIYGGGLWTPDTWVMRLGDGPTPVLLSLVRAAVEDDGVELDWFATDAAGLAAAVYRRTQDTGWQRLAAVTADGSGHVRYTDHAVTPGNRYAYRLGYAEHGSNQFTTESWVDLPVSSFALEGLRPDPAIGDIVASFSLPKPASARLELLDVAGRVRLARDVGALGAGRHTARLGGAGTVPAGVYWLRLTQDGRVLHARAVVLK